MVPIDVASESSEMGTSESGDASLSRMGKNQGMSPADHFKSTCKMDRDTGDHVGAIFSHFLPF